MGAATGKSICIVEIVVRLTGPRASNLLLARGCVGDQRRADVAGQEGIDAHAVWAELQSCGLDQAAPAAYNAA